MKINGKPALMSDIAQLAVKNAIFNTCNILVGAIGGTISNCVFCNKNCKIITLVSPEFLKINNRMKFLFSKNVILFKETHLNCKDDEIAPNIRIQITDNKLHLL